MAVQPGLCRTCSKTTLLVFPRGGSYFISHIHYKVSIQYKRIGTKALSLWSSSPHLDIFSDRQFALDHALGHFIIDLFSQNILNDFR